MLAAPRLICVALARKLIDDELLQFIKSVSISRGVEQSSAIRHASAKCGPVRSKRAAVNSIRS